MLTSNPLTKFLDLTVIHANLKSPSKVNEILTHLKSKRKYIKLKQKREETRTQFSYLGLLEPAIYIFML